MKINGIIIIIAKTINTYTQIHTDRHRYSS